MSDFKAKMHQIRFPPGLCAPDPAGGAYSTPPNPLAVFKGPTSKGREGEGEGKGRAGGRGEGRVAPPPPQLGSLDPPVSGQRTVHFLTAWNRERYAHVRNDSLKVHT